MWEEGGHLRADPNSGKEPFVIVIPPPNITGYLHIGHALNNTLQDILIRFKRMQGFEALYLPGIDHAGIGTQIVVEKELAREGKTRFDLGRQGFLERIWEWKEKYGDAILKQLRQLGCSCDWSRTSFTMDPQYSRAVRAVFVLLYKKGFIYRGFYTINWCPRCLTALSDIEVQRQEEEARLWYVKYPLKDSNTFITVATTRPETILGDTAVAVNPGDERYKGLVGKIAILPILNREIPIIADSFVDPKFGTGAVKITPAHDVNDFEASKRHDLPAVTIMDKDGRMNQNAGELFRGLDRFEARKRIIGEFKRLGLWVKEEPYKVTLGRCSRCSTVIEPYLSEQWFVRMQQLARPAAQAVRNREIRFIPERWADFYLSWLEDIHDWCISRQIWWGHRIPVWYCSCGEQIVQLDDPDRCPRCGSSGLQQDQDVLDTWFSSALWPFATLGWPQLTEDFERFYPSHVLVTGRDIIYLWVARMIITGLEFCGEPPFSDVFINPMIQDIEGRRMSKSLGTGVDPSDLIPRYGADALRFGLTIQVSHAQDLRFSPAKIEQSRNFVTKVWNAARFIMMNLEVLTHEPPDPTQEISLEDRWILSRTQSTIEDYTNALESYQFGTAAQIIYHFIWSEFCDWYIELAKRRLGSPDVRKILGYVLNTSLRMLHPLMPFVTEEIWQHGYSAEGVLMKARWPEPLEHWINPGLERNMQRLFKIVRGIREIRHRINLPQNIPLSAMLSTNPEMQPWFEIGRDIISFLGHLDRLDIGVQIAKPAHSATLVEEGYILYIPLEGRIDIEAELLRQRSVKQGLQRRISVLRQKLGKREFIARAPTEVVESQQKRLGELEAQLRLIEGIIADLEA
jgi:valyl-tRNA synthetase